MRQKRPGMSLLQQSLWLCDGLDFVAGQKQVDEIGLVFEQLFFIPKHVRFPYPD
jgi:hypothetical protein